MRLAGFSLGATMVAEAVAGWVVGNGGRWPAGWSAGLLLLAALLTVFAPPARGDSTPRFRARAATTALALIVATSIAWWAGLSVAVIALTTRSYLTRPQGPWITPLRFALSRAGHFALALAIGWGRPWHILTVGLATLAGLYAILSFCVARIASTPGSDAHEPGRRPIDFLAAGSLALLAVPCAPFLPASNLVARGLALAVVLVSGLGFFQLVRRKRSWDARAVATATHAGFRVMLLFCATATLLPWTLVSIRASAALLVGVAALAAGARARRAMLEEHGEDPASSATLSRGLEHLEQAFESPEEDPQAAELERVQRELLQVHTRLAQAQREGASDAARTTQLERRIDKLLKLVQQTEDELRRVSRMKSIDPGQASIYRNVQGLDDLDDQYEVKAELLGAIFEANLQLRRDSNAQSARQSA